MSSNLAENQSVDPELRAGCADDVACKLNATEGLLVKMLREVQELRQYHQEGNETFKQFYALGADHAVALRRAEEQGCARGLRDAALPHETTDREGDNRGLNAERCPNAATVPGTPGSYSCSDPREDARTPAGSGAASPLVDPGPKLAREAARAAGCICREYIGDGLKIETGCPVHDPKSLA